MIRAKLTVTLVLVAFAASFGCENCPDEPNVPDPSVGTAGEQVPTLEKPPEQPSPSESQQSPKLQQTEPLVEAFSAPDDAVTSEGRFAELMDKGLADHIPRQGLVFASGGVEQPTVRVVVDSRGEVRWARGDGQYWDKLDEQGEAELAEQERKKLADLVERAWTEKELTYPPSAADRGEVLVIRDGDTARVIEGSQLPTELLPLREMLVVLPPE